MVSSRPGSTPPSTIETVHRHDGLTIISIGGQAHATLAMRLRNNLLFDGSNLKNADLLIDAAALEKFDGEFERPFVELMKDFAALGGKRIFFVATRQNIRMMAELLNASSIASDGPRIEAIGSCDHAFIELGRSRNGDL